MSVEAALFSVLSTAPAVSAIIGNRLFPGAAPVNTAAPYAVYSRASARRIRSMLGPSRLAMPRIQVDGYAATYAQARAIADAVRGALDGYRGTAAGVVIHGASLLTDQDIYEAEALPPLFRVSLDFQITHSEE
jgi:hypothetical protein